MGVEAVSVPQHLLAALNTAGTKSGVDFSYLLQTAMRESSLNPSARASTSSAVGLFQFLEGTWLQVVKEEGPALGYGAQADQIRRDGNGRYIVDDPATRRDLLALRENPQMASDMAAAFTRANGDYLAERFGRRPSAGELYIAHFLGPSGAERLFQAGLSNPDQIAANLFPSQAAANPTIFFSGGQPRTIRELYRALVSRHEGVAPGQPDAGFSAQQMAGDPPRQTLPPVASRFAQENLSFSGLFKTEPQVSQLPELSGPGEELPSAFFTQLYAR